MTTSIRNRLNWAMQPRSIRVVVVTGLSAFLALSAVRTSHAVAAAVSPGPVPNANPQAAVRAIPVFKVVEGKKGSPAPYSPRVLEIPAGKKVILKITDNIGGCALVTVFPGLGVDGGSVRARVPVGETRPIVIRAAKPGTYRYHCSGDMYFGEILAK